MTTEQTVILAAGIVILAQLAAIAFLIRENTKLGGKLADLVPVEAVEKFIGMAWSELYPRVLAIAKTTPTGLDDAALDLIKPKPADVTVNVNTPAAG